MTFALEVKNISRGNNREVKTLLKQGIKKEINLLMYGRILNKNKIDNNLSEKI